MNKRQTNILQLYRVSIDRRLEDVYSTFSTAKRKAYEDCIYDMLSNGGYDFKILSYNTYMFTCAYRYEDAKGFIHLVYHTATKREDITISIMKDGAIYEIK